MYLDQLKSNVDTFWSCHIFEWISSIFWEMSELDLWHFPIYNGNSFKNMPSNLRVDIKLDVGLCPLCTIKQNQGKG